MKLRLRRDEPGVALIAVLLIMALLMGLATALTTSINMDTGLRGAYHRSTAGFYAAESGLNRGMGDYRNIFLNFQIPTGSNFNPTTLTVGNRSVTYQITDATVYDAYGNPPSITIPPGQVFGGLNSIEYDYIDSSVASNASGDTEARVNAEFKVGNIPLFQFVAFYTKDLEIAPGANMNLIGRIHTNGDMYLSADGSLFSIVDDPTNGVNTVQVSAKGKIYRGRKRSTVCDAGQVSVDMLVDANGDGNLDPMGFNCNLPDTVSPSNGSGSTREALSSELSTWKGSMINHVESLAVPLPDIGARGNGVYWTRADLRIVLNLTTTTSVPAPGATPGTVSLKTIEVQDSAGNQDATKTAILRKFFNAMAGYNWNHSGKSSAEGTAPIYYTDVPNPAAAGTGCTNTNATSGTCNYSNTSYNPALPGYAPTPSDRTYGTSSPNALMWPVPAPTASVTQTAISTTTATPTRTSTVGPTGTRTATHNPAQPTWTRTATITTTPLPTGTPTPSSTATPSALPTLSGNYSDYRRGGFYNWREGQWMYLLNVNLHDLLQWNMDQYAIDPTTALFNPGDTTDGGIVLFLSVQGPNWNTLNNYGVRLFASQTLPFPTPASPNDPTGITVVTDQALYVAGDFNAPNSVTGPNLLANGWQPAALLGDSINVLSNAWIDESTNPGMYVNDRQSNLPIANRIASPTAIDTAFLGGVDDTIAGGGTAGYNGGLENYPRFHEQWGVNFNYRGSFVSLGNPTHVNGIWNNQSYTPPTRNWNFDTQFNNAANLPPLTPRFVYVQQVLFTEQFK